MSLHAQILEVPSLNSRTVEQMLRLMQSLYENVVEQEFLSDLAGKTWVILLSDGESLRGFSTQVAFDYQLDTRAIRVLFSGDTVIERAYWGSWTLPIAWGKFALDLARDSQVPLYWLLTTKGYKTYRFLPVFFRRYAPCLDSVTSPFEAALINGLGQSRFGSRFDPDTGIVRAPDSGQRLKEDVACIDAARRKDPHIAFFDHRNPGHVRGDELLCVAECCVSNFSPFILRRLLR